MSADIVTSAPVTSGDRGVVRRLFKNPLAVVSILVLLIFAVAATLVPILGLPDPTKSSLDAIFAPLSPAHLLGGDSAGRDVLSRLIWGSRVSLLGALLAVAIAFVLGVPTGLIAGYFGGWFDNVTSWFDSLTLSLPAIVVLLAVRSVAGPSVWLSMAIFGVMLSPSFFRVVRSAVVTVRSELYIDAAKVSGLSNLRIIGRHVVSVVRAPIIIQAAGILGIAIAIQSGLEFLGIGDANQPSWGSMLNEGFRNINRESLLLLWPSIAIGLACLAFAILGNAIRDALEDSGSTRRRRRQKERALPVAAAAAAATSAVAAGTRPGPSDRDALLVVKDLAVSYRQEDGSETTVVNDVSLSVDRGEVLGLVGESGSGKTQTAFSILGLLSEGGVVSNGSIHFQGVEISRLKSSKLSALRGSSIAYIPQEPMSNLDPVFRIGSQLVEPIRRKLGLSKRDAKARVIELLERVGIADPERTFRSYPHEISGGMAQRVLIAGAVSCNPQLLIADEPTTALDVTVQAEVLDLLRDLQKETGMAIIIVTHNFGVVADICDDVAVMQAGRIVESNSIDEIFAHPQHPYTQMLLASTLEGGPARADYVERSVS